jgi:hypothetical protein
MNSIITNPPSILTPTQQSNIATYGNPTGIKTYVALLTQTGTDAPVATVLENTLGGEVVWTYAAPGDYRGTLVGVFTANKTIFPAPLLYPGASVNSNSAVQRIDADSIAVATDGNDNLSATLLQACVYPT